MNSFDAYEKQLAWVIEDKKKQIVEKADWLRSELFDLSKRLENGHPINTCGVLQGNGVELDRLIGEYGVLVTTRNNYLVCKEFEKGEAKS